MIFQRIFLWTLLNIGLYFYIVKIQNLVLKYLVFIETLQNNYKTKKKSCFHTYSQVSQRLKKNKQTNHIVFSYNKNSKKNRCSACILTLITSLLKPWKLGQYFKNTQKIFCFLLVSGNMNLYIKRIPDIKKVVLFFMLERLGFTR